MRNIGSPWWSAFFMLLPMLLGITLAFLMPLAVAVLRMLLTFLGG